MTYIRVLGMVALLSLSIAQAYGAPSTGAGQAAAGTESSTLVAPQEFPPTAASSAIVMENIPPLYTAPTLPGEGIWVKEDMTGGHDAADLVYRTFYRPSEQYPNAMVYMMLLNMKHLSPRLFLGTAETRGKNAAPKLAGSEHPQLVAVTNALWQTAHAGRGGIILRGEVLKKMDPGVAAIVIYNDDSVDILEWNDDFPLSSVRDARQLKHLIVKDGKVVTSLMKRGQALSAEIGLGSLLNESRPTIEVPAANPGEKSTSQLNFTSGDLWFIANRSAFGIRPDGNLVFAVGHHISTCDLAKALVLAGCVRAIHGDANPGNCVGVLCFTDGNGTIVKKDRLSPKQDKSTLDRYMKGSYPKDFFAFFRR